MPWRAKERCRCSNDVVPLEILCLALVCQSRCPGLFCDLDFKSSVNAASEEGGVCEIYGEGFRAL
jgi:hypothetical protein